MTPGVACPKPRPHALVKRDKTAALRAKDRAENRQVRLRSGGRCEVLEYLFSFAVPGASVDIRCRRSAVGEPHHLQGGYGRRNRGPSILAINKLAVCRRCHSEITQNILVPLDKQADAAQVRYRRVR